MDRTEYLRLCQKVSMYQGTGHDIPENLHVKYDNLSFIPTGYEMGFGKGKTKNRAILRDLNADSIIYADLERIEKNE